MEIKYLHAHFLISIGNYSNERIGFTVVPDEGESLESIVESLRERAKAIIGQPAETLYNEKWELQKQCENLRGRLEKLQQQWDATAEFLRTQGIKTNMPAMPQLNNLLAAATVEEEQVIHGEIDGNPF